MLVISIAQVITPSSPSSALSRQSHRCKPIQHVHPQQLHMVVKKTTQSRQSFVHILHIHTPLIYRLLKWKIKPEKMYFVHRLFFFSAWSIHYMNPPLGDWGFFRVITQVCKFCIQLKRQWLVLSEGVSSSVPISHPAWLPCSVPVVTLNCLIKHSRLQ